MDLWQLHIFCRVVDFKSFSEAGKSVHLSQPTISSHIRDLENHFDCKLIDRLGKEALPTKAGLLLYTHARSLLQLRDEMEAAMAEFKGSIKGRFSLGGSTIPGTYILPRLIGGFRTRYHEVILSLEIADSAEILAKILDGNLEAGIIGKKTRDPRAEQICILEEELGLLVQAKHPWAKKQSVALQDLKEMPFILREKGSGTRETLAERLKEKGFSIDDFTIIAEMGNTQAVIEAVKCGLGVSILSPLAVKEDIEDRRLAMLTVKGLELGRKFYLTRHKGRNPSPICKAFIAYILEMYGLPESHRQEK